MEGQNIVANYERDREKRRVRFLAIKSFSFIEQYNLLKKEQEANVHNWSNFERLVNEEWITSSRARSVNLLPAIKTQTMANISLDFAVKKYLRVSDPLHELEVILSHNGVPTILSWREHPTLVNSSESVEVEATEEM